MSRDADRVTARARVRVTLEISLSDRWGGDCPLDQVRRQGADGAIGVVSRMLKAVRPERVRLIGEPDVEAVIVLGSAESLPEREPDPPFNVEAVERDRKWREAVFEAFTERRLNLPALGFSNADQITPTDVAKFLKLLDSVGDAG